MFQMISFPKSMIICTRMLTKPELERNLQDPPTFFLANTNGFNSIVSYQATIHWEKSARHQPVNGFRGNPEETKGFTLNCPPPGPRLVPLAWYRPCTPGEDFSLGDGLQSDHPYTCTCALTIESSPRTGQPWNIGTYWNHQLEFNHLKVGFFVIGFWWIHCDDCGRYSYGWLWV